LPLCRKPRFMCRQLCIRDNCAFCEIAYVYFQVGVTVRDTMLPVHPNEN